MKSTKPVNLIADSMKGANEWLKNAQKKAAELDLFKGELVIITDAKGKSIQGFFKNIEFALIDNHITARYTVYHILECEKIIMASAHTDCVYDVVDIRRTTYKNYRYDV